MILYSDKNRASRQIDHWLLLDNCAVLAQVSLNYQDGKVNLPAADPVGKCKEAALRGDLEVIITALILGLRRPGKSTK